MNKTYSYSNLPLHKCTILIMTALLISSPFNDAFSLQKTSNSRTYRVSSTTTCSVAPQKSPLEEFNQSVNAATTVRTKGRALFQSSEEVSSGRGSSFRTSIREKISKISNVASMLCVIDCTVLPIVTVLLPLIGLGASSAQTEWLHEFGHSVAIFFVLPGKFL